MKRMTPLLLLMVSALPSATAGFMSSAAEPFNASFDPAGGTALGMFADTVRRAVNDVETTNGYQNYLDFMGIADAWEVQKAHNPSHITTLIMDSGITAQHEDLENKLATDGSNRHGYNFVSFTDDITDSEGHGTFMSGIVAAQVNNSQGIAGVDPSGLILTAKITTEDNVYSLPATIPAVNYAAEQGAQVVLMSFGGYQQSVDIRKLDQSMREAQVYQNTFFVIAAGNGGTDKKTYPCAYSDRSQNGMCVGSSDSNARKLRSRSNYGSYVDVIAPGGEIISTTTSSPTAYARRSGSSSAAAIVAGVVSMLLSVGINADRIKSLIMGTCDPLTPYPGRAINPYGGFVNASRALRKGLGLPL